MINADINLCFLPLALCTHISLGFYIRCICAGLTGISYFAVYLNILKVSIVNCTLLEVCSCVIDSL